MDEKIRSVLENEELLSKIAAVVKGEDAAPQSPPPTALTGAPPAYGRGTEALALLSALKPFLRKERQDKLEAVTRALSVAGIYKSVKNM